MLEVAIQSLDAAEEARSILFCREGFTAVFGQ
jgi:hypothetical protein